MNIEPRLRKVEGHRYLLRRRTSIRREPPNWEYGLSFSSKFSSWDFKIVEINKGSKEIEQITIARIFVEGAEKATNLISYLIYLRGK